MLMWSILIVSKVNTNPGQQLQAQKGEQLSVQLSPVRLWDCIMQQQIMQQQSL